MKKNIVMISVKISQLSLNKGTYLQTETENVCCINTCEQAFFKQMGQTSIQKELYLEQYHTIVISDLIMVPNVNIFCKKSK